MLHPCARPSACAPEHAVVSALLAEIDDGPLLHLNPDPARRGPAASDPEEIRDRLGKLVELVIEAGYCGPEATTVTT